ncbi:hypothetical protein [Pseudactinotalea sp.]|uniref:hypothetical protein n=1 Tax=Pseudactinotalea sp. TaxID=1926260 RepID=UPI003B3A2A44
MSAESSARRRSDRPTGWVALALGLVGIGVLTVPVLLPRAAADVPAWGGIGAIQWVVVDGEIDAVDVGQAVVDTTVTHRAEGRTGSTVVMLQAPPEPGDRDGTDVLMDTASGALAFTWTVDYRLFDELEQAAPRSDWVCEPAADQWRRGAKASPGTCSTST